MDERIVLSGQRELDSLMRVQLVAPKSENEQAIAKMQQAMKLIPNIHIEEPVPHTWHGLFKD